MRRKVLVVDIGGTHVKLLMSVRDQRDFASGLRMRKKNGREIQRDRERMEIRRRL